MLSIGLNLTVIGMAIVFFFLALLVLLTNILSATITKFFPEKEPEPISEDNTEIAIAIAAVKNYINS